MAVLAHLQWLEAPATTALALLLFASAGAVHAQAPDVGSWALEEVVTKDGKKYRGLINAQSETEVEFIEVVQPRGKPMHLVVRPIDVNDIASQQRLPQRQRRQLQDRVRALRFRSRIEAGRMDRVQLERREDSGRSYFRYRGEWFTLDSTADEETTRRCVVRVVQVFRAYRQVLPPREIETDAQPDKPLRVLLLASMDEYQAFLDEHDLSVTNPALYSQQGNLIVAASELTRYAARLETARGRHDEIRQRYEQLDRQLSERLAELRRQLTSAGVSRDAIDDEINARKSQWQAEYVETIQQLNAADRRNERRFHEVTDEMFGRLYHEAFHAYLENYLYPHKQYDVPIWLHEGLAQLFQSGRLEGDRLRIDAPLASALQTVQDDLRGSSPIALDELLSATRRDFVSGEAASGRSDRLYAHAWALSYYLAFYHPVLGTEALNEFVAAARNNQTPQERFAELIAMPTANFETQFHSAMLSVRRPR